MNLDYQEKSQEIIEWIKQTVHAAGFSQVVVAISGGVDSAVSLYLATRALGKENVYALLLPYGTLSTNALKDGKLVARCAGLEKDHIVVKEITKAVDKVQKTLDVEDSVRLGNIMARVRMMFLYDFAKANNLLVVGTENKTEYYLGYFTRFGDEASDIEPIRCLYKTHVWEMAKFLEVPQEIIEKAPSANLWEGQSDEKEFGFSYQDADRILYHYFEEHLPEEGLVDLGFEEKLIDTVLGFARKNDFKHHVPFIFDKDGIEKT